MCLAGAPLGDLNPRTEAQMACRFLGTAGLELWCGECSLGQGLPGWNPER